jgi:hypothetical protein
MKKYVVMLVLMAQSVFATTNEIAVQALLKVNKGPVQINRTSGTVTIQMAGNKYNTQTISATTTNALLTKGNVGNAGWCYMRNLSTNAADRVNITFDAGSTTSLVLEASEPAIMRLHPSAIVTNFTVSSSAGSVDFEFTVIED